MNKTLHIISHTHWDREWYLNFEAHRMRFVEVLDDLLDILDNDSKFKSFHLDGQLVLLDDYLEIRPQNKKRLLKHIKNKRIVSGPLYVLQDEFLTSAESNLRNLLYGIKVAQKYGVRNNVGYFPDTFGHISQMPQILNGFNIKRAVIGRGINPIGRDNSLIISPSDQNFNSEFVWESPDKSAVTCILFANWYNNAYKIPSEKTDALKMMLQAKKDAEAVAATPHLLLMNGCDHTPVQRDVSQIIHSIKKDFPDTIIHSNFDDYFKEIEKYKEVFKTAEGELTSQFTDGNLTLVNTASTRMYIRILNFETEKLIQKYAEPLNAISYIEGDTYRSDFFWQAWKYILMNHSHDSIANCNVDDVSENVVVRFKKAAAISKLICERSFEYIINKINTTDFLDSLSNVTVFNPMPFSTNESVCFTFELDDDVAINNLSIVDSEGNFMPSEFIDLGQQLITKLPKDDFRKVYCKRQVKAEFIARSACPLGYTTYRIINKIKCSLSDLATQQNILENQSLKVQINQDGSLDVLDKNSSQLYKGLMNFVLTPDKGDTYNYIEPKNGYNISTEDSLAQISLLSHSIHKTTYMVKHKVDVPVENNISNTKKLTIDVFITLKADSNYIEITCEFNNNIKDCRLRAHFKTNIKTEYCYADSHFDIVKRKIKPWKGWSNPDHSDRQQCFVEMSDQNKSLLIANKGLPEYEVLRDDKKTIALTLARCVGSLGDWGDFPTKSSQCQGKNKVEFAILPFEAAQRKEAHKQAYAFCASPFYCMSHGLHSGDLPFNKSYLKLKGGVLSCFKKAENKESLIVRVFNPYEDAQTVSMDLSNGLRVYECRMDESNVDVKPIQKILITKKKIMTFQLKNS